MKYIKQTQKKILMIAVLMLLFMTVAACDQQEEIVFGQGDWDSNVFHDEVARYIIENGYDVPTRSVSADTAIMISTLKTGDIDVAMEIWSDNIPTYSADLAAGEYIRLGVNFGDNAQGLYIPKYLTEEYPELQTVEDLKDFAHLFPHPEGGDKGIIYGGPQGWAATAFLEDKIEVYGLGDYYEFRSIDSNSILSATLADAYRDEQPWVGYNWEPTWIMGIYDMVLLEDTQYSESDFAEGIGAFPSVSVDIVITNDFEARYPEITEFLRNYTSSSDLTSDALGYMVDNDATGRETAIWFLKNNEDIWSKWVSDEALTKILDALNNETVQ